MSRYCRSSSICQDTSSRLSLELDLAGLRKEASFSLSTAFIQNFNIFCPWKTSMFMIIDDHDDHDDHYDVYDESDENGNA